MTKQERDKIVDDLKSQYPIEELVKFSEMDFQEKVKDNTFLMVKYKEMYYYELSILEELEVKLEKLQGMLYKKYRFEEAEEYTKVEIEKYCLPSDVKVIQMKDIIARQQIRARFFEICYKALEKMQWSLKTFHDSMRSGV